MLPFTTQLTIKFTIGTHAFNKKKIKDFRKMTISCNFNIAVAEIFLVLLTAPAHILAVFGNTRRALNFKPT